MVDTVLSTDDDGQVVAAAAVLHLVVVKEGSHHTTTAQQSNEANVFGFASIRYITTYMHHILDIRINCVIVNRQHYSH